jgi:integrase
VKNDDSAALPAPRQPSSLQIPAEVVREEFTRHAAEAEELRSKAVAKNTLNNYQRAWNRFSRWCFLRGVSDLPASPATVLAYVMAAVNDGIPHAPRHAGDTDPEEGKKMSLSGINIHLSAITFIHTQQGHPDPVKDLPKDVMKGLRRTLGKPPKKKMWLSTEQVLEAASRFPRDLRGKRDKALLLIGFLAGGRRRSEVASLHVEHLQPQPNGSLLWVIPNSKTDQEGEGFSVPIPALPEAPDRCPVRALRDWLEAAGIEKGAAFCSIDRHGNLGVQTPEDERWGVQPALVAEVVKKAARILSLDPDLYAGHSLRSGFITSMSRDGVSMEATMKLSGHKTHEIAYGYAQLGQALAENNPVTAAVKKRL